MQTFSLLGHRIICSLARRPRFVETAHHLAADPHLKIIHVMNNFHSCARFMRQPLERDAGLFARRGVLTILTSRLAGN